MKLYHGSNVEVKQPQILESDRKLDFGTGFYVTTSFEQAEKWAELTAKRRNKGKPVITVYEYNEAKESDLRILRFLSPDSSWLRFVSANRKNELLASNYDLIIGPVANDKTMPVISLYFTGVYTEEETIKRLLPQKLRDQYVFKTEKALSLLTVSEVIEK
ncbi:MAG: DUF3990 domain-containing protein [Treponema sp.]|nr:DUF3990 domain-containing protein [Candidatus Treponema caballi]